MSTSISDVFTKEYFSLLSEIKVAALESNPSERQRNLRISINIMKNNETHPDGKVTRPEYLKMLSGKLIKGKFDQSMAVITKSSPNFIRDVNYYMDCIQK